MEQSTQFDLDLALHQYLSALDDKQILSPIEREELVDHFLTEVEVLEDTGLSTEEAFLISQKRFGEVEMIQVEYQKAKPWARMLPSLLLAMNLLFFVLMIVNLRPIISFSTGFLLEKYTSVDMATYLEWGDIGVQTLTICMALVAGFFLLKKWETVRLRNLWPIPFAYVLSFIGERLPLFVLLPNVGVERYGQYALNASIVYAILMGLAVVLTSILLFHKRNQHLQLA